MISKTTLLGNVGNDPEIRNFDNGGKVANFSLATSENWKDKNGEKQTKTEWHRIAVFGKLADIVEKYITKGSMLYLEGKNRTRDYENNDGIKIYVTEVVIDGFGGVLKMIGGKKEPDSQKATPAYNNPDPVNDTNENDDLPF